MNNLLKLVVVVIAGIALSGCAGNMTRFDHQAQKTDSPFPYTSPDSD